MRNRKGRKGSLQKAVERLERSMVLAALEKSGCLKARAARSLGMSVQSLTVKMNFLGITVDGGIARSQDSPAADPHDTSQRVPEIGVVRMEDVVAQLERAMVLAALEKHGGNQKKAARDLGIDFSKPSIILGS